MNEKQLSIELAKAMIGVQNLSTRLNNISKDLNLKNQPKKMFNDWIRMLERIKTEFKMYFPIDNIQKLNDELFSDEVAYQLEAINSHLLCLPKEFRDSIESELEKILKNQSNANY